MRHSDRVQKHPTVNSVRFEAGLIPRKWLVLPRHNIFCTVQTDGTANLANRSGVSPTLAASTELTACNASDLLRKMAERVGFEPTVDLRLRLISSQVHSTTLPPLRDVYSLLPQCGTGRNTTLCVWRRCNPGQTAPRPWLVGARIMLILLANEKCLPEGNWHLIQSSVTPRRWATSS